MNYAVLTTAKPREVHMHRFHNLDNHQFIQFEIRAFQGKIQTQFYLLRIINN